MRNQTWSLNRMEDQIINNIFFRGEPSSGAEKQSKALMRDEFLMNLSKFTKHIQRTMQQLEGKCERAISLVNVMCASNPVHFLKFFFPFCLNIFKQNTIPFVISCKSNFKTWVFKFLLFKFGYFKVHERSYCAAFAVISLWNYRFGFDYRVNKSDIVLSQLLAVFLCKQQLGYLIVP